MKSIKDELQDIIYGDDSIGSSSQLKKIQSFLRKHAKASRSAEEFQYFKNKEATAILGFADSESLFYESDISEKDFISEGAEQKVYRFNGTHVLKTNAAVFYECWLDYFNSLLIHNYFFLPLVMSFSVLK